jgi:hypothetical protein
MPQVPYSPVPQVQQQINPVGNVSINAPVEAFGGASAQGLDKLGHAISGVGDEMFKRAIALQQLDNDTKAKQADSDYMISAGNLHAQFGALQGQDAVKAYPKYSADLKAERERIRESLPNDMAKKMYDSQSLSTMGRSIFNGAGQAATAQKQYVISTAKAQMVLDAETVSGSPGDEALFKQKLQRTEANAVQVALAEGKPPESPQGKLLVATAISNQWYNRIKGLSQTSPFEAKEMMDKHQTDLLDPDRIRLEGIVTNTGRAVGAANIANEVYAAGKGTDDKPGKSFEEMEVEVRKKAKALAPKDPILEQHAVSAFKGQYNNAKYVERQQELTNMETVKGGIQSFGGTTVQQLRADPKIAAAIDNLPKSKTLDLQGTINRFNSARDQQTKESAAIRLNGLSNNDVEAFLNTDVTKEPLSKGDMITFMNKQAKLKANPSADPRVSKAINVLKTARGAELEALGIFNRTTSNKEDYDHYTGALQSAIEVWMEDHGNKPPDAKTIADEIGPSVIRQRTEKGWLWNSKVPFYQQTVPNAFADRLKADVKAQAGYEPTEQEVYKAYVRKQYLEFYKKAPKAPKDQGRAP